MESKNDRKLRKHKPALENMKKWCPKKRTRRGYGKKNNRKNIKGVKNVNFTLLGTNANGILGKQESLKSLINKFMPSVITVQEGKQGKKGLLKLKGYQIFERVRLAGQGGGLLTAVDQDLLPVLVSASDDDEAEVMTVQVKVGDTNIRIINAYGPQEDDSQQKILNFWAEVENEIIKAKDNNCLLLSKWMQMPNLGKTTSRMILTKPLTMENFCLRWWSAKT